MDNAANYKLRVAPQDGKWSVSHEGVYYPKIMEKNAAIAIAAQMGKWGGILEIAVCDKDGDLVETLDIIQTPEIQYDAA